jgi:hypothetical protein
MCMIQFHNNFIKVLHEDNTNDHVRFNEIYYPPINPLFQIYQNISLVKLLMLPIILAHKINYEQANMEMKLLLHES